MGELDLDWQFKVEELPIDPDDPKPPQTGDGQLPRLMAAVSIGSLLAILILIVVKKQTMEKDAC